MISKIKEIRKKKIEQLFKAKQKRKKDKNKFNRNNKKERKLNLKKGVKKKESNYCKNNNL